MFVFNTYNFENKFLRMNSQNSFLIRVCDESAGTQIGTISAWSGTI